MTNQTCYPDKTSAPCLLLALKRREKFAEWSKHTPEKDPLHETSPDKILRDTGRPQAATTTCHVKELIGEIDVVTAEQGVEFLERQESKVIVKKIALERCEVLAGGHAKMILCATLYF